MKTLEKIKNITKSVLVNELMSNHTYYKIGGPAKIFVAPESIDEFKEVMKVCVEEKINYFLLGKGSNILVSDKGYDGCIIDTSAHLTKIHTDGEKITAEAGSMLSKIAKAAEKNSLTGFEELAGIPGTIGGALIMNAGCYGSEISEKILRVKVICHGTLKVIERKDMEFRYRRSSLAGLPIVEAEILLKKGQKTIISDKMKEFQTKRKQSQPLHLPSCGSVFKRPLNNYAGKLIEDCGLKGVSVGGAMVSNLHAGFIVNSGNAKAADVLELIKIIKKEVFNKFKVELEEEVIFLGFKPGELK